MDLQLIIENLTNPALLFFALGILSVQLKSDLQIPESSSKFISLYLLFSIGFKGGQELSHAAFTSEMFFMILFGVSTAILVPIYSFFILKRKLGVENAGAIAAAYGSISAVTFITCIAFLELQSIQFGGYMIATMALMEAPAIIVGVFLINLFQKNKKVDYRSVFKHALTNGSVVMILGSLVIGYFASAEQAAGIAPFTTDLFKGFLAIFLLDMGIVSGRKLSAFYKNGSFTMLFALLLPLFNGVVVAILSGFFSESVGDRLLLSILAASASYIAVPAAMKIAVPRANPGLYIPMALAVTFPINITIGMPIYIQIVQWF
ncbi:sodium-dependent bicarbonate transport family permease [Persicobacter psychrovividus]|uniref:Sodium-dependent bicarbonate transport family permease n=1 Tax=Persicobacter psychrovividus TaxID=387638 RepID=A0ABN6L9Z9_9BACT|nr:sodium-dependent bicarbonate transport family permease [Persicobacter psychrovividus]